MEVMLGNFEPIFSIVSAAVKIKQDINLSPLASVNDHVIGQYMGQYNGCYIKSTQIM